MFTGFLSISRKIYTAAGENYRTFTPLLPAKQNIGKMLLKRFSFFVLHVTTSEMFLKCFTLKHLQQCCKKVLQMYYNVEHTLKIGSGYVQNKTFANMFWDVVTCKKFGWTGRIKCLAMGGRRRLKFFCRCFITGRQHSRLCKQCINYDRDVRPSVCNVYVTRWH